MALNDPLANALSLIDIHEKHGKDTCRIKPASAIIKTVLTILQQGGYVGAFKEMKDSKGDWLKLDLIGNINKVSVIKPRFSVTRGEFEKYEKRFLPARNIGHMIISTSAGIMTHHEAKKKNLGGRLLAYCY